MSPVLERLNEDASEFRRVELSQLDQRDFEKVVDIWCGKDGIWAADVDEVVRLASVANRFEIVAVEDELDRKIASCLTPESAADMLSVCSSGRFPHSAATARRLALWRFDAFSNSDGFLRLEEQQLAALLDDDELDSQCEELVLEAAVRWISGGDGRGWALLGKVRFPLMSERFLELAATLPPGIPPLAAAALRLKRASAAAAALEPMVMGPARDPARPSPSPVAPAEGEDGLGPRATARRVRRMERYVDGGEARANVAVPSLRLALCGRRACVGTMVGVVVTAERATLEVEDRVLQVPGVGLRSEHMVLAMVACGGRLLTSHSAGGVRAWDPDSGASEAVVDDLGDLIPGLIPNALASLAALGGGGGGGGGRLAGGAVSGEVGVWRILGPGGGPWPKEAAHEGHEGLVGALVAWGGRPISGGADRTVRVWPEAGGAGAAVTLAAHGAAVVALAVRGDVLYSAAKDGSVLTWAAGTWAPLGAVTVCGGELRALAVTETRVVCAWAEAGGGGGWVGAWEVGTLEPVCVAPQAVVVSALVAADGEQVWGVAAAELLMWGRPGQ